MAKTRNTSELRPFNFSIVCDKLPNSTYFLQSFVVPDLTIAPIELASPDATSRIFIPGDGMRPGPVLTVTMKMDEEMSAWFDFYDWMRSARHEDIIREHMLVDDFDLFSDISIVVRNNNQKRLSQILFRHCWPTLLGNWEMKTTSAGDEIVTFQAEIACSSFIAQRPSELELMPKGEPQ